MRDRADDSGPGVPADEPHHAHEPARGRGGEHPYTQEYRDQQPSRHDETDGELVHQPRWSVVGAPWPGGPVRAASPASPVSISCWACSSTVSMSGIPTGSRVRPYRESEKADELDHESHQEDRERGGDQELGKARGGISMSMVLSPMSHARRKCS